MRVRAIPEEYDEENIRRLIRHHLDRAFGHHAIVQDLERRLSLLGRHPETALLPDNQALPLK